ncbi:MAG TPA: tRNA (adenosine(37)-N6)-threonylcarbamoyltransferase complex dimerization subunit type 1 TsaB [Kofleriaceae bacterium]|nr:tRNA (adenosine(37)-N6)-threonylcarbamoyltransferase complex dimerization subunit type 1 TsaB [Kofleriaceae bacterium]
MDTSTRTTSIALGGVDSPGSAGARSDAERRGVWIERTFGGVGRDSELLVKIDELCRDAGVAPRELEAVAVGAGPGSFTGLRIGMATAKGIAFAAGRPLWVASSLAALAWRVREVDADVVVAVIDARRGEVYAGAYARETLEPVAPEAVMPPGELAAWAARIANGRRTAFAGDFQPIAATPSALGVIALATRQDVLVTGAPHYLRPSEAEVKYPDGVPGALRKR